MSIEKVLAEAFDAGWEAHGAEPNPEWAGTRITAFNEWYAQRAQQFANARVIAAAPDMLKALKRAAAYSCLDGPDHRVIRAAIRKAEGAS